MAKEESRERGFAELVREIRAELELHTPPNPNPESPSPKEAAKQALFSSLLEEERGALKRLEYLKRAFAAGDGSRSPSEEALFKGMDEAGEDLEAALGSVDRLAGSPADSHSHSQSGSGSDDDAASAGAREVADKLRETGRRLKSFRLSGGACSFFDDPHHLHVSVAGVSLVVRFVKAVFPERSEKKKKKKRKERTPGAGLGAGEGDTERGGDVVATVSKGAVLSISLNKIQISSGSESETAREAADDASPERSEDPCRIGGGEDAVWGRHELLVDGPRDAGDPTCLLGPHLTVYTPSLMSLPGDEGSVVSVARTSAAEGEGDGDGDGEGEGEGEGERERARVARIVEDVFGEKEPESPSSDEIRKLPEPEDDDARSRSRSRPRSRPGSIPAEPRRNLEVGAGETGLPRPS